MDVAALSMKVESTDVVKATGELDKFAASADRAAASAGKLSGTGSTAKLGQDYAKAAQAATQASGSVNTMAAAVTKASTAQAAANAHVVTYRNHLQGIVAASGAASAAQTTLAASVTRTAMATQQADAQVIAYRNNLERQVATSKAAGAANATAATGVVAVGTASRATSALVGGLAGILGGLVGVILGSVVSALIEMAAKLFENDEAMKAVTVASDNLGAAQSALGQMFDLSTGKIKNNTEAIRGNVYMQMIAMQQRGIIARQEANEALRESGLGRTTALGRAGTRLGGFFGQEIPQITEQRIAAQERKGRELEGLVKAVAAGMPIERAGAELNRSKMGDKDYFAAMNALNKAYDSFTANRAAGLMEGALNGGGLPAEFLQPGAAARTRNPRGRSGGKTDAEKIADLVRNAQAEITAEQNRSKAVQMSAEAAAELEQRTKLLNAAASAGLKITPALAEQINKLSAAYAEAKIAADVAEVTKKSTDAIEKQMDAIADQTELVGLYGDALARARREQEAQRDFRAALPNGAIVVQTNLTGKVSDAQEALDAAKRLASTNRERELTAYALDLERNALGLTGEAALEYAFIAERLNEAKRAGIELSAPEIAAIKAAGAAYATQRNEIDKLADAMAFRREVVGGFFRDFMEGTRNGASAIKAFADAAVNALNRIIDKMLDQSLDKLLNMGKGGGFLDQLLGAAVGAASSGGLSTANTSGGPKSTYKNALGGIYGDMQRFAKGSAFSNSIVSTPTLFRFANGAKLGEMGEAGPEAIVPLKRGADGSLGVQMHGRSPGSNDPFAGRGGDTYIWNVKTPDANSFRRSSRQMQNDARRRMGGQ